MTHDRTFTSTADLDLGNADDVGPGRWVVQFVGTGWTGSVQPKARLTVRGDVTPPAFANCAFTDVADGTIKTTAPTASGMILVEGGGRDIRLTVTVGAGSVRVLAVPLSERGSS